MSIYNAENEYLSLKVKKMGAELNSLVLKSTGCEYIWQGNPDIWYGQSPILFPFVGRLLDDKYRVNSREFTCPKHGVARKRPFKLVDSTKSSLTFLQTEDKDTLLLYPYKYNLFITYELQGEKLVTTLRVDNTNSCIMYFSIGAHPGFNCDIGDTLNFSTPQTVFTERIDETGILTGEIFSLLINEKALTITENIFDNDALIISGLTENCLTLKGRDRYLIFRYFDAPLLGVWAKPNAPYVCLEPWFGINDNYDKKNDISEKREILSLKAKDSFSFRWEAQPGVFL